MLSMLVIGLVSSLARPARCSHRRGHLLGALDIAIDVAFGIP